MKKVLVKLKQFGYLIIKKIDKYRLENKNFIIVNDNCWGAEIYKHLDLQYNTPFVGLFIYGDCYLKLLNDFLNHMNSEIKFITSSKYFTQKVDYPIGLLKDVEIHFLHYKDEKEARDKWERRTQRMLKQKDFDNYFFKMCEGTGCTLQNLLDFHSLSFKNKISFSNKFNINHKNDLKIILRENESFPSGIGLYRISHGYFDHIEWLNNSVIKSTFWGKLNRIFY